MSSSSEEEDIGNIEIVSSSEEYEAQIDSTTGLLVVYWMTPWSGPCNEIGPIVAEYSNKYSDVKFLQLDVEDNAELAKEKAIRTVPTFQFIKQGEVIEELNAADAQALRRTITRHTYTPQWGKGYRLLDTPPSTKTQPITEEEPKEISPVPAEIIVEKGMLLPTLLNMGFPAEKAARAIEETNAEGLDQAVQWIFDHSEGNDVSSPVETKEGKREEEETKSEELDMKEKLRIARELEERRLGKGQVLINKETNRMAEERKRKEEMNAEKQRRKREKRQRAEIRAKIKAAKEKRMEEAGLLVVIPDLQPEANEDETEAQTPVTAVKVPTDTKCSLAIRLPTGSVVKHDFKAMDTLRDVHRFLKDHTTSSNFSICTNYPRKIFEEKDFDTTLLDADLVPRAALTVSYVK